MLLLDMAYRLLREFRQAFTRLDTPPFSNRRHPGSDIARAACTTATPRSVTNFAASSLNSRLNTRRCMETSDRVGKPKLGVHQTSSRPFPGNYSTLIDTPRGKTTDRGPSPDGYPEPEPVIVVASHHKVVTARRKNRESESKLGRNVSETDVKRG